VKPYIVSKSVISLDDGGGMATSDSRSIETHLRAAVESAPSGLVMADASGRIVLVNREIERMFGYAREELLGRPIEMLVPQSARDQHPEFRGSFLRDPRVRSMGAGRDLFGVRKDGVEVPVEIGLTPVPTEDGLYVLGAVVDISARKRQEEEQRVLADQLRQAQKLEAVGTLAGGIAHDFNNLLAGILGYAELIEASATPGSEIREDATEIVRIAGRGKSLVERILAFSRRKESRLAPIALSTVVAEIQQLLRATLPGHIELVVRSAPDLPLINADSTSVHQVVMNLATNGAQAMPRGGRLELVAAPLYVRDSIARANPGLSEGPYVMLEVRDSGAGMRPETMRRAFEPFFTTKAPGEGTGLGLAMVHGIMHEHRGAVQLESELGVGTVVRCLFPATDDAKGDAASIAEAGPPLGHGELVLLVDDEPALLAIGRRRLEALGYEVCTAASPAEAITLLDGTGIEPALLITDYSMPGMSGLELGTAVGRLRPHLPVVLLTEFISDISDDVLRAANVQHVLRKPLTVVELADACARALRPPEHPDR
jgi:PAS domain S-box-containing protein